MDEPVINPIVDFKNINDLQVWGQKTLQSPPVAMDRIGVRRKCLFLEKEIRKLIRVEEYSDRLDPNFLPKVMAETSPKIEQFLENCRLRKAFESYSVGTFTTSDRSEVTVKFKVKPESEELTLKFWIVIDSTLGHY